MRLSLANAIVLIVPILLYMPPSGNAQGTGGGDVFSTNTAPEPPSGDGDSIGDSPAPDGGSGDNFGVMVGPDDGSDTGGALPGEPAIDRYGRDAQCGGTNRAYYDRMYGTKAVVISPAEANQHYIRGEIIRCGVCPPDKEICWLKPGTAANTPSTPASNPPAPANVARAGDDEGMRCPSQPTPQAIAAGCRWMSGQDLCARPDWYTHPQCVSKKPPATGPTPTSAAPCTAQLKSTGNEALDTMVGMGQQADRMLTAFGQTIGSAAAQAMNPQAFLQQQIQNVQILMGMMAQDNRTWKAQVWQGMLQTLEQAKKDPATAIGSLAAQRVLGGAVASASGAAANTVCSAGARVKKALDRVKELKQIKAKQPKAPPGSQGKCTTLNPSKLQFGCLPRSIAADIREDTKFRDWTADNFKSWSGDRAPSYDEMTDVLKSLYGDRRFGTLTAAENLAQADGNWIPVTVDELKTKMRAAGDGARALVIAEPNNAQTSHAFNVAQQGGLHVFDAESGPGGVDYIQRLFDPRMNGQAIGAGAGGNSVIGETKFWYFRTAGPDMVK